MRTHGTWFFVWMALWIVVSLIGIVVVIGEKSASLQPGPHSEHLTAAHRQQCSARRELALIIAMASYAGVPVGNLDEDTPEGDPNAALVEEIYARPEWRPLAAAREIEARCLAQSPH